MRLKLLNGKQHDTLVRDLSAEVRTLGFNLDSPLCLLIYKVRITFRTEFNLTGFYAD